MEIETGREILMKNDEKVLDKQQQAKRRKAYLFHVVQD